MSKESSPNATVKQGKSLKPLLVGIKRRMFRQNDKQAKEADAAFRAQRKGALERANYRCIFCGFKSQKSNEVHHLDNNHHNNDPKNLACVCKWCHPYHHIGEAARRPIPQGLEEGHLGPKATALFRVPKDAPISPQDMNHLMRAIGIALSDEKEAPYAKKIFDMLISKDMLEETARAFMPRKEEKITRLNPLDMAAALSQLTDDEYQARESVLSDVRLAYAPGTLAQWGRAIKAEQPAFADPADWEKLLEKPLKVINPQEAAADAGSDPANESVGVEALVLDDEEDDDE